MKAELQFFMSSTDAEAFLDFAKDHIDSIDGGTRFVIGDCEIVYKASRSQGDTLFMGTISINSGGIDDGCKDQNRANDSYRQLRNWIKKSYYSRLNTWTEGNEEKSSRTRNQWLGPDAKTWLENSEKGCLRSSETSSVYYGIAPEIHGIGGVEPSDEKFKLKR